MNQVDPTRAVMTASELVCALRSGQPVADYAFDDLYPLWARRGG
jgi:hypothetical protein